MDKLYLSDPHTGHGYFNLAFPPSENETGATKQLQVSHYENETVSCRSPYL
jgi:hypothetical protein